MFDEILKYVKLQYYRYTLMTGIYMLDPAEVTLLHAIMVIASYFIFTQGYGATVYFLSFFISTSVQ